MLEKEILYNWYNNRQAPYKEQLKILFSIWCLSIFNKTFELNEDNLYTFLSDYFKFKRETTSGTEILIFYNKFNNDYITCLEINTVSEYVSKKIITHIRENI
jgi:hypothetical protein